MKARGRNERRYIKITRWGKDSRGRCENNPGLELALNPQMVSLSCISRLIVVAHRTGKLPSIKKKRDTRQ